MSSQHVPGFGGWEIVDISHDKPYIPNSWKQVTCKKCGNIWTYKGLGIAIRCSVCHSIWHIPDEVRSYNKFYRQTPEYKMWNRLRSRGKTVSMKVVRCDMIGVDNLNEQTQKGGSVS